jgi:hypothetical protein
MLPVQNTAAAFEVQRFDPGHGRRLPAKASLATELVVMGGIEPPTLAL